MRPLIRFSHWFWLLLVFNLPTAAETAPRVLFFGDSLTAGYGINPEQAYPAKVEAIAEAAGQPIEVIVGAVSGDTSAGGLRRVDWMLRRPVDIFVLALGANDGLRGVEPEVTFANLAAILKKVRKVYPEAHLVVAGMRLPPSMGKDYTKQFAALYPRLAKASEAELIPYLLEGVGGDPELNLPDRIHPNPEGHARIASTVWKSLKPLVPRSSEND